MFFTYLLYEYTIQQYISKLISVISFIVKSLAPLAAFQGRNQNLAFGGLGQYLNLPLQSFLFLAFSIAISKNLGGGELLSSLSKC